MGASFFISCGQEAAEKGENKTEESQSDTWEPNMYEASELVLIMRQMHADLTLVKEDVAQGKIPGPMPEKYKEMHTAMATNPQEIDQIFHAIADKWMGEYQVMTEADTSNVKLKFNALITTCVDCHQNYCLGPIPKIEKLYIK
jgi:hypothetical protein